MIYCTYVKSSKKAFWHLAYWTHSQEQASEDLKAALKKAQDSDHGNKDAEVATKTFESRDHIPEFLKKLDADKILYN